MTKIFEYIPDWVKIGIKVKILYNGIWYKGIIQSTPDENERGIDIFTDTIVLDTTNKEMNNHIISIPIYMTETDPDTWKTFLLEDK